LIVRTSFWNSFAMSFCVSHTVCPVRRTCTWVLPFEGFLYDTCFGPLAAAADVVSLVNTAVVSNYYGSGYSSYYGTTPGGISIWAYYSGTIPAGHIYEQLTFYPNAWASFINWININNSGEI